LTLKLVVLDIDGTIVGADFALSCEMIHAVRKLQAAGVAVTLATGRMLRSARDYAERLGIAGPVICYQGALTADAATGRYIRHEGLAPQVARSALARLSETPGFGGQVLMYVDDEIYTTTRTEWSDGYEQRMGIELNLVDSLDDLVGDDLPGDLAGREPTLILAVDTPDAVGELVGRLREEMDGKALITHSLPHFCEVGSTRAGKSLALEHLAGSMGIDRGEVIAFGDGIGDAGMLRWAGIGVAMSGGHPAAIAEADRVVEGPPGAPVARLLMEFLENGDFE
jgi:Cof subfamily protein (haloacid dehalogenase superfamily)